MEPQITKLVYRNVREEPCNTNTLGSSREIPVNYPKGVKGKEGDNSAEVSLHQCTQNGKQARGAGNRELVAIPETRRDE